ncbi:hypothetical protein BDA96_05G083600 [Sorghum bicolor]|uniref:Alcohol dehydrogenase-like C-terminal domain-containing protein n=1 Tax=Sorghum bicolor TaxID=4558 RepID=A0A921QYR2_SORBI|nr:hypothetical protein BDA96_05G083600 [Sorghum bicolor]
MGNQQINMASSGDEKADAVVQNKKDMGIIVDSISLQVPAGQTAVLVKNLDLSCDPWMCDHMSNHDDGLHQQTATPTVVAPDFVIGEAMVNFGVGKVIDSTHPAFTTGDLTEYLNKINHSELPLSYYTGVLGMPGRTAYSCFFELGKPKKGNFVFVSVASGAVVQIVRQLAKIAECYVVGRAGSDEKVNLLKTKFGYDDWCLPDGIDIYFNSIGGETLDAVLLQMRHGGRVAFCGMISQYNLEEAIDSAPAALIGLFSGKNVGKQLVAIARP